MPAVPAPTMTTNVDVGQRLGLSHSGVSRIRSGERTGSLATLIRIADTTGIELASLVRAAHKAQNGDRTEWVELMAKAFGTGTSATE